MRDVTVETSLLDAQIRQTRIQFSAAPLDSNKEIILGWAAELGPLIVRRISSTEPSDDRATSASALYAAYLAPGERSDAVQLASVTELSLPIIVRRYVHSGFVHIIRWVLIISCLCWGCFYSAYRGVFCSIRSAYLPWRIPLPLRCPFWVLSVFLARL